MPESEVLVFTIHEVAERLKCSDRLVYNLVAEGRLAAIRLREKNIRVPVNALRDFINRNGNGAAPQGGH